MKLPARPLARLLLAAAPALVAVPAAADDFGSALVYPLFESGPTVETLLAVANTDESVFSAPVHVRMEFLRKSNLDDPYSICSELNRTEELRPADGLTVAVSCAAPGPKGETQAGYAVVYAIDPATLEPIAHDHLIGSVLALSASGAAYSLPAIPFGSPRSEGSGTDLDGDGKLDFNGNEYAPAPDRLYVDSFLGRDPGLSWTDQRIALVGLTGGRKAITTIRLLAFNDDAFVVSSTYAFRCWANPRLVDVSPALSATFMSHNLPNDPNEVDLDCDGQDDAEAGWLRIDGLSATTKKTHYPTPTVLGALTQRSTKLGGGAGRLPWHKGERTTGSY